MALAQLGKCVWVCVHISLIYTCFMVSPLAYIYICFHTELESSLPLWWVNESHCDILYMDKIHGSESPHCTLVQYFSATWNQEVNWCLSGFTFIYKVSADFWAFGCRQNHQWLLNRTQAQTKVQEIHWQKHNLPSAGVCMALTSIQSSLLLFITHCTNSASLQLVAKVAPSSWKVLFCKKKKLKS